MLHTTAELIAERAACHARDSSACHERTLLNVEHFSAGDVPHTKHFVTFTMGKGKGQQFTYGPHGGKENTWSPRNPY